MTALTHVVISHGHEPLRHEPRAMMPGKPRARLIT